MEGAPTPDFLCNVLTRGAPEESDNGYIAGNKSCGQAWRTEEGFCFFGFFFFSHLIIYEELLWKASVRSPSSARNSSLGCPQRFRVAISVSGHDGLFLLPACRQPCISAAILILANVNVYVHIYGLRYKNGWRQRQ